MKQLGPLVRVIRVEPLQDFVARVTFADGAIRDIDLEPFMRGSVFEPIRDNSEVFRAMKVEGNTISWENGADIDPDVLYYELKPAWQEESEAVR